MSPIPSSPDDWFHVDDPFPDDIDTLVLQIRRAAEARRHVSQTHPPKCACCGCRVRHIENYRYRMAQRDADRAATRGSETLIPGSTGR